MRGRGVVSGTSGFHQRSINLNMNTKEKYHNYLNSNYWKEIRDNKLKKKKCCVCSSRQYLLLHHISYKNIYKAKRPLRDTIPICKYCHYLVHTIQWKNCLTYEDTQNIIFSLRKDYLTACRINIFYNSKFFTRINNLE